MQQNPNLSAARQALTNGIAYIAQAQQANGSFPLETATKNHTPSCAVHLLIHAYLLDLLGMLPAKQTGDIRERLAQYIITTMRPDGVLRDYASVDTHALFHALAALYAYDPHLITTDMIAAAVQFLITHELQTGGPYYNARDSKPTPELATNITISRFIHYIGGPFPQLNSHIARHYTPQTKSRYYHALWPLTLQVEHTNSPHRTESPSFSVLFSEYSDIPVDSLMGIQQTDGSWPTKYFCVDPSEPTVSYGSRALTTTIALCRLAQPRYPQKIEATKNKTTLGSDHILKLTEAHAHSLNTPLSDDILRLIRRIAEADHRNEIGPLAVRLSNDLQLLESPAITRLQTLGIANLYNWAAYTIYDTVLDERVSTELLPAANVALRSAITLFSQTIATPTFDQLLQETYTRIDTANAWELKYCRTGVSDTTIRIPGTLPDYGDLSNLADRSLSHSLPAIGTLVMAGFEITDPQVVALRTAFSEYIIIRQLSDDLHDWQEDLRGGRLTYVVTQLLTDAHIASGLQKTQSLTSKLEKIFWKQTLPKLGTELLVHATKAREHLAHVTCLAPDNVIDQLIRSIEDMMRKTMQVRVETDNFLHAYKQHLK